MKQKIIEIFKKADRPLSVELIYKMIKKDCDVKKSKVQNAVYNLSKYDNSILEKTKQRGYYILKKM